MTRISLHNGRGYNPKHNDRTGERAKTDGHIEESLSSLNRYDNYYHDDELEFDMCEKRLYTELFSDFVNARNERYKEHGQLTKCKDVLSLLTGVKTCPIESIYQLGDADTLSTVSDMLGSTLEARKLFRKILLHAFNQLKRELKQYDENYIFSCVALHGDESSIHIHARTLFVARNERGELTPNMTKALEKMGFSLPDPNKASSRYNNLKMSFDKYLRQLWIDCLRDSLKDLKRQRPDYESVIDYLSDFQIEPLATRENIEKNDYIIKKQTEKIEQLGRIEEYKDIFEQYVSEQEESFIQERSRSRGRRR